jgi:hypothetical protein
MLIVTGADARCFAMTGVLSQSLARWLPGVPLQVADFGLTDAQRRFLEADGRLLRRPASVAEGVHPYLAKAALADYLAGREEPVVWFDSDMIAVAALAEPLTALLDALHRTDAAAAACPDAETGTIDAFVARWPVAPFAAAAQAAAISYSRPYLNSGFFACTAETLRSVRDHCQALEQHQMIDQNAFNLAAWSSGRRVMVLDTAAWNVHGHLLGQTRATGPGMAACGGRKALLLHATSIGGSQHEERSGSLRGPSGDFPFVLKFFRNEHLARLQRELLSGFVAAHRDALEAAGCFSSATE